MLQRGSFQRRVFLAMAAVSVVPAVLALLLGTLALREIVATSGSAGPWDQVAESGRTLIEAVEEEEPLRAEVARAAREHRDALSSSLRLSRLYSEVTLRLGRALPFLALGVALFLGALSLLAARWVARSLSRPVEELAGWTGRIVRGEPLPPEEEDRGGIREFDHLRASLRGMAAELDEARRQEIESVRLRSWTEMARRVAHELKNPLTPMRMAAATLTRQEDPATAEAGAVLLEEVSRLEELARSFSRMGRMPEGPPSEVDLEELLASLAALHRDGPVEVRVEAQSPFPTLVAHHEALRRALQNLVGNAVEAAAGGPPPGHVLLRAAREGGEVVLEVEDSGPGIPAADRERIWEPDFTTRAGGTGLGLPLVLQTVRHHGGEIEVEEGALGGARFRIRLPVGGPPAPAEVDVGPGPAHRDLRGGDEASASSGGDL